MFKFRIFPAIALAILVGNIIADAQDKNPFVRLDPAVDQILPTNAKLEKLADGIEPALEGGVWVRKGGYLLYSNKPKRLINKWTPDGKISVYLTLAEFATNKDPKVNLSSGTTLDKEGRFVYCSQGDQAIKRVEKDGRHTVIVDSYEGKRLLSPNDLVYKSNGTLYFTDNGNPPKPELIRGTYYLKDGKMHLITTELMHPNGIGLSPDEKYLYINDSGKKVIWRFEIQADDSAINGKVFFDMSSDKAPGVPDGMKVDKKGNIFDAGPGGLWIISPEGKHLGSVHTPDSISNLAFGDADGKSLFLMLHSALYRIKLNTEGLIP